MNKVILTAQVGEDGVLNLTVPLGRDEAKKAVRVIVEPMDRESWLRFLAETGGKILDPTFERHPQGEYEQRDPQTALRAAITRNGGDQGMRDP
jgi:hypothetical protein